MIINFFSPLSPFSEKHQLAVVVLGRFAAEKGSRRGTRTRRWQEGPRTHPTGAGGGLRGPSVWGCPLLPGSAAPRRSPTTPPPRTEMRREHENHLRSTASSCKGAGKRRRKRHLPIASGLIPPCERRGFARTGEKEKNTAERETGREKEGQRRESGGTARGHRAPGPAWTLPRPPGGLEGFDLKRCLRLI